MRRCFRVYIPMFISALMIPYCFAAPSLKETNQITKEDCRLLNSLFNKSCAQTGLRTVPTCRKADEIETLVISYTPKKNQRQGLLASLNPSDYATTKEEEDAFWRNIKYFVSLKYLTVEYLPQEDLKRIIVQKSEFDLKGLRKLTSVNVKITQAYENDWQAFPVFRTTAEEEGFQIVEEVDD